MHYGGVVLKIWANACGLYEDVITDLKASSTIQKKSLLAIFRFDQLAFTGEDIPLQEENLTLLNLIFNAAVEVVDKRDITEFIALYTSTTQLLQGFLRGGSAREFVAKLGALLDG